MNTFTNTHPTILLSNVTLLILVIPTAVKILKAAEQIEASAFRPSPSKLTHTIVHYYHCLGVGYVNQFR